MAVQINPYRYWEDERDGADYRSRETQASALTRQMMRQPEYLLRSNRVNPGPSRNLRSRAANAQDQVPHETRNEDIWGWQRWTDQDYYLAESPVSNNLLEEYQETVQPSYPLPPRAPSVIVPIYTSGSYVFEQPVPSNLWIINHDLGFYPSVELFDSARSEIDGNVTHVSISRVHVEFTAPVSGYARLN